MDVNLKFQSITILKLWVLYLCGTKWPFVPHCLISNWRTLSSCTQLTWANRLGSLVRWTCSTTYAASLLVPRPHSYGKSHHRSCSQMCISAALSWHHSWQIISYLRVRSLKSHKMKCSVPRAFWGRISQSRKVCPVSSKNVCLFVGFVQVLGVSLIKGVSLLLLLTVKKAPSQVEFTLSPQLSGGVGCGKRLEV